MAHRILCALIVLLAAARVSLAQTPTSEQPAYALSELITKVGTALEGGTTPCDRCCFDDCGCATERLWFRAEYLMWWFRNTPDSIPFVTTFPAASTSAPPGALGQPDTRVVLGGHDIDTGLRHGGRFTLGGWLDRDGTLGVEGSYLFVATQATTSTVTSGGGANAPILTIPFFNPLTGMEDAGPLLGGPINAPGLTSQFATLTTSNHLMGAEANGVWRLACRDDFRISFLGGFRWLQLNESLTFTDNVAGLPGSVAQGFAFTSVDQFATRNNFYGGQLGTRAELTRDRWIVSAAAKVALGDMHENVVINGVTHTNTFTGATALQTLPGGIFTQPSNMGSFNRDHFAVIPEVNLNVGYKVTERLRAFVGYTFLYVSDAAHPADQIDRVINPTQTSFAKAAGQIPLPPVHPVFNFSGSDFWAQGINFGIDFRF